MPPGRAAATAPRLARVRRRDDAPPQLRARRGGKAAKGPDMVVILRCGGCLRDTNILPVPPASLRGLVHCMRCGGTDLRMYALADADDDRSGSGDKYELRYIRPRRNRGTRRGSSSSSAIPAAAAAVLGMADKCAGCTHRRDTHVNETGRCGHITAGSEDAGPGRRCGCMRFAVGGTRNHRSKKHRVL